MRNAEQSDADEAKSSLDFSHCVSSEKWQQRGQRLLQILLTMELKVCEQDKLLMRPFSGPHTASGPWEYQSSILYQMLIKCGSNRNHCG